MLLFCLVPLPIFGSPMCSAITLVPFGVLTDVAFDSMYYGRDRNLFPFEILMFWIAALVPALLASLRPADIDRLIGLGSIRDSSDG